MESPVKKTIPAHTVVCIRHQGAYGDIGKLYQELFGWASAKAIKPLGPAYTTFLSPPSEMDWGSSTFEVCLAVPDGTKADGKMKVRKVPAASVMSVTVKGPYSDIPAHYTEFLAWMDVDNVEPAGAPREVYVKHPGNCKDPKQFVTEIQFPVED